MTDYTLTKERFDAMLKSLHDWKQPEALPCHPTIFRMFLREAQPNRHALYSAGWRSGFTVNGMRADG